ncbi:non-hydrolyzing UDP-N-acetylglucosamine 2-epimerase [Halorussus halobius]|uniref:non-hydrolyzing UDP-N-acetylglucosamine 2-epimerase n=1 Tax=Halorussus halobius TaxID=1710537 RepID=UPI001091AD7C|nr:UDP-N-acetylglucosamine 2-epimerase (non-hydrolyzing) [Halorussus halobius]
MRILSVVGARPQFIKAFSVSRELRPKHDEILVHTGQHYDEEMSDVFFDELGIPEPDYNLGVGSDSHAEQTAAMMTGLEELVDEHEPDVVLCYGDTNSTLAAGIVASKMDPELAHVEAGLRSFNRDMPEEVNRVLTDHASDYLFVPSGRAAANLREEGVEDRVYNTGDVMYDSILWARERAADASSILDDLSLSEGEYALATVHRPRNTDEPERLATIVDVLGEVSREVVLPAHPRTVSRLEEHGLREDAERAVTLIDPVGYLDFVRLLDGAWRVVTDSGGVQKEAFFLDTPCVTLREETEWDETVESGWNVLVGADRDAIRSALDRGFDLDREKPEPYGDGNAAEKVRLALEGRYESES